MMLLSHLQTIRRSDAIANASLDVELSRIAGWEIPQVVRKELPKYPPLAVLAKTASTAHCNN
jgi:hypothetical protein